MAPHVPELSVVIPVRGLWPMTRRCLELVRRNTPESVEVLVVDGGSPPAMRRALAAEAKRWPALTVLELGAPRSFAQALNHGLRAARGRVLVWLNNDAFVSPGWSGALLDVLAKPGVGAAGPRSGAAPRGLSSERVAAAWSLRHGGGMTPMPRLYGWCLAVRREAYESVGLLDERLVWGEEDDDYCFRLRLAGWRLVRAEGSLVFHSGAATRGRWPAARRRAHLRANAAVLREKWVVEAGRIRRELGSVLA